MGIQRITVFYEGSAMSIAENEINQLKKKISELENENRLLKDRLSEAGISYADIINAEDFYKSEKYDPE